MEAATYMLRTGRHGGLTEFQKALFDLRSSLERIGLAWLLAWHDIVARYRGSILGPFWITLSMGLMVVGIGFLYAQLLHVPLHDFMPYVAIGIVFFGFITGVINEGCDSFIQAAGMLSQTNLPMFTFVWRTVLRNLINLAHHLVIIATVLVVFGYWRTLNLPGALLGLSFLILNASWISMLAAIGSARFRDVPQIVVSGMQFAMFMTPVFWTPTPAMRHHIVLTVNPFFHMLESVRGPLLNAPVAPHTYLFLSVMAGAGWALTFTIFALTRRRIVHYL
jgi:ABC-type polysaccharide/polyol phosphate export permease